MVLNKKLSITLAIAAIGYIGSFFIFLNESANQISNIAGAADVSVSKTWPRGDDKYRLALASALDGMVLGETAAVPLAPGEEEIVGEISVLFGENFDTGRLDKIYEIKDLVKQKTYQLKFTNKALENLRSGTVVKARGKVNKQEFVLSAGGETSISTVLEAPVAAVSGAQNTIVLGGNFTDKSLPCSAASIDSLMFSEPNDKSVDDLYQETSYGAVSFSGQVLAPLNIDYSSATCNYGAWASALDSAAAQNGININDYNRRVYVLPQNACPYAGLGYVGTNPSQSWIFRCNLADIYAHELGHNLGMHHASTPSSEYGDYSDIMGIGGLALRQINAPHKQQMGWTQLTVADISQSGVYNIAPLEYGAGQSSFPFMLRLPKDDTGNFYYISYRRGIGFDANLGTAYKDKVNIHYYPYGARSILVSTLSDGGVFADSVNGITIKQLSHGNEYAAAEISLNCTANNPSVTLAPLTQMGKAGDSLAYSVQVTNNDVLCEESYFDISASVPDGWQGSLSTSSLIIPSGAAASASLTITSPLTAAGGNYAFSVKAVDSINAARSAAVSGSYLIDSAAPTAPADLTAVLKKNGAQLSWSASRDGSGIKEYRIFRNGMNIAATQNLTFTDSGLSRGTTYSYYVAAVDNAGNVSAPSNTVSVTTATKGNSSAGNPPKGKGNK